MLHPMKLVHILGFKSEIGLIVDFGAGWEKSGK
jgi:hypothetical protein